MYGSIPLFDYLPIVKPGKKSHKKYMTELCTKHPLYLDKPKVIKKNLMFYTRKCFACRSY